MATVNSSRSGGLQLKATLEKGPYGVPLLNGVPLVGSVDLPQIGLRAIYYDKTENWNRQLDFIGQEGCLYIYSDYAIKEDDEGNEIRIPNVKIGDGTTPLIDTAYLVSDRADNLINSIMAELEEQLTENVQANVIEALEQDKRLVTAEDRSNWNRKVTGYVDPENEGNLILSF